MAAAHFSLKTFSLSLAENRQPHEIVLLRQHPRVPHDLKLYNNSRNGGRNQN